MRIRLETVLVIICGVLFLAGLVKANPTRDNIKQITEAIEKDSSVAENYLKRGDLYAELWEKDKNTDKIINIALAAADYSKFISFNQTNADVYRKRAAARYELFLGVNTFTIADLQKVVLLEPNDTDSKSKIIKYQAEYKKMYRTEQCVSYRGKSGFQGHPTDIPMTSLSDSFDSEMTPENTTALKSIACGADVNYRYKFDYKAPEFSSFSFFRTEHLIAMIEAGANIEGKDSRGNTPLINTFSWYAKQKEEINQQFIDELKIFLQYGANLSAKNLKGQTAISLAKKIGNKEVITLLEKNIVKTFDGTWTYDNGRLGLSVKIKEVNGKLEGDYSNFSTKTSEGKILSSKIIGNTATIEIDCDWGGKGTVQITRLSKNRLHWKVIKFDKRKGEFIVLVDQILTKK